MNKDVYSTEIVRCRDCCHRPTDEWCYDDDLCPCQIEDVCYSWIPDDDWFCANGEINNAESND